MASKDMRGGNYAAELQPKEIYKDRRRRILERVGEGMVVMWGAGDDRGYGDVGTFRQSSSFFYLTGVELPNAAIVLRPGEGGDLLFLPPRNPNVERWTGPKWGPGGVRPPSARTTRTRPRASERPLVTTHGAGLTRPGSGAGGSRAGSGREARQRLFHG